MPIKGKQIVDNTIHQKQLGVKTESVVNNTDVTTKGYVDKIVNDAIAGLTYTDADYNLSALNTSGTAQTLAVNHPISKIPVGGVRVYVNGIEINVGPGLMSFFAPESSGTPTPREFEDEQPGDYLWWDPDIAKYQLESTDDVDFVYRTYTEDYPVTPITDPIYIHRSVANISGEAQTGLAEAITIVDISQNDLDITIIDQGLLQTVFVSNVQFVLNDEHEIFAFTYDVSKNTNNTPRTNTIKISQISDPSISDSIDIIQDGTITRYITFDNDTQEYTNTSQVSASAAVSSNVPASSATASVIETHPFVSNLQLAIDGDTNVEGVSFDLSENTGTDVRTNTIHLEYDEDSTVYDEITIKQYPSPSGTLPSDKTLNSFDTSFTTTVTSNVPWALSASYVSGQNFINTITPNNGNETSGTTITVTVDDAPPSGDPDNVSNLKLYAASPFPANTVLDTQQITQPASH